MSAELIKKMIEDIRAVRDAGKAVTQKGGKKYTMVQDRIEAFRKHAGAEYSISTEIVHWSNDSPGFVVVKATIRNDTGAVVATGHAEEVRGASYINETSALENCETSAVGRALAILGIHGGEFASADEIQIAENKRERFNAVKPIVAAPLRAPLAPVAPKAVPAPQKQENSAPESSVAATAKPEPSPQVDLEEAIQSAGGAAPATPASSSKLLQGVREDVAGAVERMDGGTPILSKVEDMAFLKECFETLVPLCTTVNEAYSFWHSNEARLKELKAGSPELYKEVRDMFTAHKAKLTKKDKSK